MSSTGEFIFSSTNPQDNSYTIEFPTVTLTELQNASLSNICQPQSTTQQSQIISEKNNALKELLLSWNCEFIFSKCVEECVDIEILKLFKLHHIKRLMKEFPLGLAVKFEHHLCQWQMSQAITAPLFDDNENIFGNENENNTLHVKSIIEKTSYGLNMIYQYKKERKMTDSQRNFVVNLIIDFVISKKMKMTTVLAKEIAEQIVSVFSYEEISTYYHKIKGKHVTGKIYQKYFNKTKSLVNIGLKRKPTITEDINELLSKYPNILVPEENIDLDLAALKANECTWAEVEDKWKKTSTYRLNNIKNIEKTCDILDQWHYFRTALGYKLVLIDFKTMFPSASDILTVVDKFPSQIIDLYKNKIKETSAKSMIDFIINDNITHNGKLLTTFYLLHYILVPRGRTVLTVNNEKLHKKYSIRDSQNAFLIVGSTVQQLEEMIEKRLSENCPVQPLLIVTGSIGDPKEICVYYDRIRYKFDCVARAIDVCFKLFHVFNLEYPRAANLFWNFIQEFFFNIKTKNDNPTIKTLINELNLSM